MKGGKMWDINVNILPTSLLPFFRLTRHRSNGLLSGTNKCQRAIRAFLIQDLNLSMLNVGDLICLISALLSAARVFLNQ